MLFYFFVWFFGISAGSFLNVLIDRLPQGKSIQGRSHCPHCQKTLRWYELIPLFSFVFLKGRCLGCKKSISWQYPVVELATGLLFVATAYHLEESLFGLQTFKWFNPATLFGHGLFLFGALVAVAVLIVIFASDLKYMLISEEVVLAGILAVFFYQLAGGPLLSLPGFNLQRALFWGVVSWFFFFLLVKFTKGKGMGIGDIKIATLLGLFLGDQRTILALFLAFLLGAMMGVVLILAGKKSLRSQIPFGPFLVFSCLLTFLLGQEFLMRLLPFSF